jgi:hypothetical protein
MRRHLYTGAPAPRRADGDERGGDGVGVAGAQVCAATLAEVGRGHMRS